MNRLLTLLFSMAVCSLGICASCDSKSNNSQQEDNTEASASQTPMAVETPFRADSAYMHIERQVSFGPRVPNSAGHARCADYLVETLERYGFAVTRQRADLKAYDGTLLKAQNIIAEYMPERAKRILLFAHWDTRPIADHDKDSSKRHLPIDGADDGASGVGVLLELARNISENGFANYGIDIIFMDAEDYGVPDGVMETGESSSWALGSQYWSSNPHRKGYSAEFGILLDMVGSKNAKFHREFYSQENAGWLTSTIWSKAASLGYGNYFINKMGAPIMDDHVFVMLGLGIPCVDIINYDPDTEKGFGHYWHTHNDNMEVIDRNTLQAVGNVVWEVLRDKENGK